MALVRGIRSGLRSGLLAFLLAISVVPAASRPRSKLDKLASKVASAIRNSALVSHKVPIRVLVVDFDEDSDTPSQLGHALAVDFADAMRQHAKDIVLLNQEDIRQALLRQKLPDTAISSSAALSCYAPVLGADVVVNSWFQVSGKNVVLQLNAWDPDQWNPIFVQNRSVISLTDSERRLASEPDQEDAFYPDAGETWVSSLHPPVSEAQTVNESKRNGFDYPRCILCPNAPYPREAAFAHARGTVVLRVQILSDGLPSRIAVVRGLPCGLTQSAIDTVKGWRLKPAMLEGQPVNVEDEVEVMFHPYWQP